MNKKIYEYEVEDPYVNQTDNQINNTNSIDEKFIEENSVKNLTEEKTEKPLEEETKENKFIFEGKGGFILNKLRIIGTILGGLLFFSCLFCNVFFTPYIPWW
jgi:hypothetical protein